MPESEQIKIRDIFIGETILKVILTDGNIITTPYALWPRLRKGTHEQRCNCRLIGDGEGIHWPDLDEDISLENLIEGKGYVKI